MRRRRPHRWTGVAHEYPAEQAQRNAHACDSGRGRCGKSYGKEWSARHPASPPAPLVPQPRARGDVCGCPAHTRAGGGARAACPAREEWESRWRCGTGGALDRERRGCGWNISRRKDAQRESWSKSSSSGLGRCRRGGDDCGTPVCPLFLCVLRLFIFIWCFYSPRRAVRRIGTMPVPGPRAPPPTAPLPALPLTPTAASISVIHTGSGAPMQDILDRDSTNLTPTPGHPHLRPTKVNFSAPATADGAAKPAPTRTSARARGLSVSGSTMGGVEHRIEEDAKES